MRLVRLAGFVLVAALIALPAWAVQQSASGSQSQAPAAAQSVTGTVVSVTDTALTLNTATTGSESKQSSSASEMHFVIDSNTKIDGTPAAGARATVEYTTDANGRKVATHISIQS